VIAAALEVRDAQPGEPRDPFLEHEEPLEREHGLDEDVLARRDDHRDRAAGHARTNLEVLRVVVRADEPAALVVLDVVLDAGAARLDELGHRRGLARIEHAPLARRSCSAIRSGRSARRA
jgi:hypothetical protein